MSPEQDANAKSVNAHINATMSFLMGGSPLCDLIFYYIMISLCGTHGKSFILISF